MEKSNRSQAWSILHSLETNLECLVQEMSGKGYVNRSLLISQKYFLVKISEAKKLISESDTSDDDDDIGY